MPSVWSDSGTVEPRRNDIGEGDLRVDSLGDGSPRLSVYHKGQWWVGAIELTVYRGQPSGYATLDAGGKVPAAQLSAGWTLVAKPSDTTRTDDTLAADPHLQFAMAAATRYRIRGRICYDTGATADFKWRHAGPADPTLVRIRRAHIVPGATAYGGVAVDTAFSAEDVAAAGTGTNGGWVEFDGVVLTAGSGTFSFQWAQLVATGGENTVVRAGSYLEWMAA